MMMVMALTVSGAFPSGSMVTAACPVTGILATGGGWRSPSLCAWVQAMTALQGDGWVVDEKRMEE